MSCYEAHDRFKCMVTGLVFEFVVVVFKVKPIGQWSQNKNRNNELEELVIQLKTTKGKVSGVYQKYCL